MENGAWDEPMLRSWRKHRGACLLSWFAAWLLLQPAGKAAAQPRESTPYNIIYILSDDHRYDFMGFMHRVPGLETPHLDQLAREGAHLQNAFVTTSLCSPSRASILTGQYAHTHHVVDNQSPLPPGLVFFPEYLQRAGYQTAFMGKWHMGNTDGSPMPGFDEWISFSGQGVYENPTLNINGKVVRQKGYITKLLTDHALHWLDTIPRSRPFFLYLSHKAVHAMFRPEDQYKDRYRNMSIVCPPSMYLTATDSSRRYGVPTNPETPVNMRDIPSWVRHQRYSWHGVDHPYDGQMDFEAFYRQYCETLLSVDESVGRLMQWLRDHHLAEHTLVVYMGDNGFQLGEHGLIDKRDMYEASIRVPLLAWCPPLIKAGTKIRAMVENIDIAPTFLDLAGVARPPQMQGRSFLPLLEQHPIAWRDRIFYEYYWEAAFPMTPTIFGVRTDRYKYIYNWGVWDINELYDLQQDPYEMNNLIRDPRYADTARQLKQDLWTWLAKTQGMEIPLKKTVGKRHHQPYQNTY